MLHQRFSIMHCMRFSFVNLVILLALQISWDSVMRMSVDLRDLFLYEAFLYYNPLLLVVSYHCTPVMLIKGYSYIIGNKLRPSVCIYLTVILVFIVGLDDLVVGSKSMGLCTIICELCKSV